MRSATSLKREFLKKWVMGLQICKSWKKNKNMDTSERKKAIKLSADIAIASTRKGTTCWSRALISDASKNRHYKFLVQQILGTDSSKLTLPNKMSGSSSRSRSVRMTKMSKIRRSLGRARIGRRSISDGGARSVAERLVRKRTEVLKRLVPGGRFMNGSDLIEETLDYIVALRAQVDVMRSLAVVSQIVNLHGN